MTEDGSKPALTEDDSKTATKGQAKLLNPSIKPERWDSTSQLTQDILDKLYFTSLECISKLNGIFSLITKMQETTLLKIADALKNHPLNLMSPISKLLMDQRVKDIASKYSLAVNEKIEVLQSLSSLTLIKAQLKQRLDNYYDNIEIDLNRRDENLHSRINILFKENNKRKICIIAGALHVKPAIEFLKNQNISFLGMEPKGEPEIPLIESEKNSPEKTFFSLYKEIKEASQGLDNFTLLLNNVKLSNIDISSISRKLITINDLMLESLLNLSRLMNIP